MRKVFIKSLKAVSTGSRHRLAGQPCQDAAAIFRQNQTAGICLSDGAGSATHSQIGAGVAAKTALDFVAANLSELWKEPGKAASRIFDRLHTELSMTAETTGVSLSDLGCTLLFVFIEVKGNNARFLAGNLGDGLIITRTEDTPRVCLEPENAEYANQTWFVTSHDGLNHFRVVSGVQKVVGTPGWILSTDGAAPFLYGKSSGRFAPAAMSLFEDARTGKKRQLQAAVSSLVENVIIPRTDDDCSIGILQVDARRRKIGRRPSV